MSIPRSGKKIVERTTDWQAPPPDDLDSLVRLRKTNMFWFNDDGMIPNHPHWPLIVYHRAVRLPDAFDPAAVFEALFHKNGWEKSWRNGIYDYAHYHSAIHEVLGIARGSGEVLFGGPHGRKLSLKAGDVAILPAGTGHQLLSASDDFLVVGAYPPEGKYDECSDAEDHARAVKAMPTVPKPQKDPVHGSGGPLAAAWLSSR